MKRDAKAKAALIAASLAGFAARVGGCLRLAIRPMNRYRMGGTIDSTRSMNQYADTVPMT